MVDDLAGKDCYCRHLKLIHVGNVLLLLRHHHLALAVDEAAIRRGVADHSKSPSWLAPTPAMAPPLGPVLKGMALHLLTKAIHRSVQVPIQEVEHVANVVEHLDVSIQVHHLPVLHELRNNNEQAMALVLQRVHWLNLPDDAALRDDKLMVALGNVGENHHHQGRSGACSLEALGQPATPFM